MSYQINRRTLLGQVGAGVVGSVVGAKWAIAEAGVPAKPKGRIRQSVSKWCYNGKMPYEELVRQAARIGYQGIDLIGPEDWPIARKYGLVPAIAPGAGSIAKGFNRKEHHAELVAEMNRNIDLAAEAGVPSLVCLSGERKGQADEDGVRNCIAGLKQVAGHAEARKINICIEYLNSKIDHKDYQFDHMAYGVSVIKGVGSPRVGILYDIYHAQIMEGDIIRTIRENHPYILHYHTGGNPGRNEIDETQELNYSAIMRAIADTGFKGFIAQEFVPKGDPVGALEQAFAICDV